MIAMVAKKKMEDDEDEPPKGGIPNVKPLKDAVSAEVSSLAQPDETTRELMKYLKLAALAEDQEAVPAAGANVSSDDEERKMLNTWHVHCTPRDYNGFIKTRSPLDSNLDTVTIGESTEIAPQRMKKVRLKVKDEETGRIRTKWELRPETTMTPLEWRGRPPIVIKDWSEIGLKRARKEYEEREEASRQSRAALGKAEEEDISAHIHGFLLRRPPGLDMELKRDGKRIASRASEWFVSHPDGCGLVFNWPYMEGIVCPQAEADLAMHNEHADQWMARKKQEILDQIWPRRDLEETEKESLDAYATDLKNREISYPELQREEEAVTETLPPICAVRPVHVNKLSWPWKKGMKADEWSEDENFIGKQTQYDVRTHNEPEHFHPPVVVDDVIEGTCEVIEEEVIENLPLDPKLEQVIKNRFKSLSENGILTTPGEDGKVDVWIRGFSARLDYDDPMTRTMLENLLIGQRAVVREIENHLAKARISQGQIEAWVDPNLDYDAANEEEFEVNMDGLLDDANVELKVERVQSDVSPDREVLHNQTEYARYKEEMRILQNRGKFFDTCREMDERREKTKARRLRIMRNRVNAHKRRKDRERRAYFYRLLHEVREIHKKLSWTKRFSIFVVDKAEQVAISNRLAKVIGHNRIKADTGIDYRVMKEAAQNKSFLAFKGLKAEEIVEQESTVPERPREFVEKGPEPVVKRHARQNLKYDRKMVYEDLVVPGTERIPAPIRAVPIPLTSSIQKFEHGDYDTPIGKLVKKHILTYRAAQPRSYFRDEAKDETVEDTGHGDQVIGPAAYRSPDRRRIPHGTAKRIGARRTQRMNRAA